jgi:valyl-tRNA synthetase
VTLLEDNLKLLHPFVPFVSEAIWQDLAERSPEEALIVADWPKASGFDADLIDAFQQAMSVVSGVRTIRKEKNIPFRDSIELLVIDHENVGSQLDAVVAKLGNISQIQRVTDKPSGALTFRVRSNEYYIPVQGSVDVESEVAKIEEELAYTQGFLNSVRKKLANERFVNNAPQQVVDNERKKEADALARIKTLEDSLKGLK